MSNRILPPCAHCQFCQQLGRQNPQRGRLGRKRYFCNHPLVKDLKDKNGLPLYPFVGFGDMTAKSPLALKGRKRWCPLMKEESYGATDN